MNKKVKIKDNEIDLLKNIFDIYNKELRTILENCDTETTVKIMKLSEDVNKLENKILGRENNEK